jgi:5-methyltetrahydropteroyltriglutamate--homocysteine methyltransferase
VLKDILLKVAGKQIDAAAFQEKVKAGVAEVVRRQAEIGIDVPSDGEFSKPSFTSYVAERLSGLGPTPPTARPYTYARLQEQFPGFMAQYSAMYTTLWMPREIPAEIVKDAMAAPPDVHSVTAPITYRGHALVQRDIANFRAALEGLSFVEAFMPSATPSRADVDTDHIYPTESAYLYALAEAMHEEYKAIVDAGFIVQLDLGLPARNQVLPGNPDPTWAELRRASEMQIEAYNHALRGIPEDRVRYHLCWGSMNTPHTTDVPLREIIDLILKINAQA